MDHGASLMLMSFVLLPIITNQKLIDSIPVFLAFTISPVSLCLRCFFFFLDCIPIYYILLARPTCIKLDDTHTKPQLLVTFNIESPSLGSTTCYCASIILNYMGLNQN